jgi:succinate---hydroxymethylglutarate CoA-transferase
LNFKHPGSLAILNKIIDTSDILVENYVPGTLKKFGLDFPTLSKRNPRLIYASITGYGQTGPYAQRPGYDVMVEAEMGLMHITGEHEGPPVKVGVAITDLSTGLYTCTSILAAFIHRMKMGKGQHIDVSLSDVQVASLANIASSALIDPSSNPGRWGTAHPSIVPYQGFPTKDGRIMIGAGNDRQFNILAECIERPELATDEKFLTNSLRVVNREELLQLIEDEMQQKTTQEWLDIFEGKGMPYAAVKYVSIGV